MAASEVVIEVELGSATFLVYYIKPTQDSNSSHVSANLRLISIE